MPTNNFLPFCPTDTGTNLLTQSAYAAASDRTNGNQPGVASSRLNNKALRQSSFITSQLAQYVADTMGVDVLDDGVTATWLTQLKATLTRISPVVQRFTSGSGTWNRTYAFIISSGSATVGATYTNNAVTFTVAATVASATLVYMTGNNVPAASGTLTKASGTGDSSLTFYAARAPIYIEVEMVGGGAGGQGSGTAGGSAPTAGGNTTFGSSFLTASGGAIGSFATGAGGAGGSTTITGTAAAGITATGGGGTCQFGGGSLLYPGGNGGATALGGAGRGGEGNAAGVAGATNTGGGGGGGGISSVASSFSGPGGGGGGYIRAKVFAPAVTYAYAVGAGGTGGGAGTSGAAGAAGGSGVVVVTEYYQ